MAIQWFPGHMHLTRKAIGERIKEIDVVIEMLDARLPGSSANPMLAELIKGKPALKILSKQDLADPVRRRKLVEFLVRRGFDPETAWQAVRRGGDSPD